MSHVAELVCIKLMTSATMGTSELMPLVVQYMVDCFHIQVVHVSCSPT